MLRQSPYFKHNKEKYFGPDTMRIPPSKLEVSKGVQLTYK
jgi:hypothetical protein